jgi:hypothetical protein
MTGTTPIPMPDGGTPGRPRVNPEETVLAPSYGGHMAADVSRRAPISPWWGGGDEIDAGVRRPTTPVKARCIARSAVRR